MADSRHDSGPTETLLPAPLSPQEQDDVDRILARVGKVAIVVGLVDICLMFVTLASGHGYGSDHSIFAVVAGVYLCKGSLKAARLVTAFVALHLAGFGSCLLIIPLLVPADLIWVCMKKAPFLFIGWGTSMIALFAIWFWTYRLLTRPVVKRALGRLSLTSPSRFPTPAAGFSLGIILVLVLGIAGVWMQKGTAAQKAIEAARAQRGAGYKYYVSSLSGFGDHFQATVVAYNRDSIEKVEVEVNLDQDAESVDPKDSLENRNKRKDEQ